MTHIRTAGWSKSGLSAARAGSHLSNDGINLVLRHQLIFSQPTTTDSILVHHIRGLTLYLGRLPGHLFDFLRSTHPVDDRWGPSSRIDSILSNIVPTSPTPLSHRIADREGQGASEQRESGTWRIRVLGWRRVG
jgi:hypothetical protein